jgi:hypothetical protein
VKSSDLPPSLTVPCDRPVALPDRALSDRDVEIYWLRDRRALAECADKAATLSAAITG